MAIDFSGQAIDNVLLSKVDAPIGTYRHSDLTLTQFLTETPGQWVLADGQSCIGTGYHSKTGKVNVPDMRGTFMRMKDHGRGANPDGDLPLGQYTADAIRNIAGPSGVHFTGAANTNLAGTPFYFGGTYTNCFAGGTGNNQSTGWIFDASRAVPTAADNRPKNVTVNIFFKVGY
jgi:hypothetical protein